MRIRGGVIYKDIAGDNKEFFFYRQRNSGHANQQNSAPATTDEPNNQQEAARIKFDYITKTGQKVEVFNGQRHSTARNQK